MSEPQATSAGRGSVVVVDVGARWGAAEAWRSLAPEVRVFGFDPDPEECSRLNEAARTLGDVTTTYVPVALGPRHETVDLHVTRQPACSSIYPPLVELIEQIPVLADIAVEETVAVELQPLDDWCAANGVGHVDVLKIDTQGSELGVLQGAVDALSTCLLVECEVEFNPIYEGQPLFSDVDAFLRAHGFVLWRFANLVHYTDDDVLPRLDAAVTVHTDARPIHARIGGGQLYWGDAHWVRAELCGPPELRDPALAERAARVARAAGLTDLAARIMPGLGPELLAEARRARRTRRAARRPAAPVPARPAASGAGASTPAPRTSAGLVGRAGARARGLLRGR